MPYYEFICSECGHRFVVRSSWSQKKEVLCPRCGSATLQEVFGLNVWNAGSPARGSGCGTGFG